MYYVNPITIKNLLLLLIGETKQFIKFISPSFIKGDIIPRLRGVKDCYSFLKGYFNFWSNFENKEYINFEKPYAELVYSTTPSKLDINHEFRQLKKYPLVIFERGTDKKSLKGYYLSYRGDKAALFTSRQSLSINLGYNDILTYEVMSNSDFNKIKDKLYKDKFNYINFN